MVALTALQGLRNEGHVQPRQRVLIQGASGAHVTAVCSPRNIEQAQTLGADQVIDYTHEDFTQNGQGYDLILAANGYHPLAAYKRALTPSGIYVMAGGTAAQIFQATLMGPWMSEKSGRKMGGVTGRMDQKDLGTIGQLIEAGKVRPVIDRCYPLSEAAEALRYLGAGHARGKVVINVEHKCG